MKTRVAAAAVAVLVLSGCGEFSGEDQPGDPVEITKLPPVPTPTDSEPAETTDGKIDEWVDFETVDGVGNPSEWSVRLDSVEIVEELEGETAGAQQYFVHAQYSVRNRTEEAQPAPIRATMVSGQSSINPNGIALTLTDDLTKHEDMPATSDIDPGSEARAHAVFSVDGSTSPSAIRFYDPQNMGLYQPTIAAGPVVHPTAAARASEEAASAEAESPSAESSD